jgi:hypothetical protein
MVFLDASDPAGWFGLLPPSAIVDQGVWIGRDDGGVIDIPADDFEHSAQLQAEFNLTPDGNATGRLTGRLTGFRAWEWAGRAAPGDIESYLRSTLMPAATGFRVLELRAPSRVEDGAVEFALEIALQGAAMAGAGGLYFRPTGPFAHMDNPFVDPQRPFPVAFDFPHCDLVRITWRLPEGYTVAEVPRGGGKHTNDLDYTCGIVADGRTITVERRLNVGRRHFPRSAYGELQDFFGGVVDIDRSLAVGIKTAGQTTAAYSR